MRGPRWLRRLFEKNSKILTSADLAAYLGTGGSSTAGVAVNSDTAMRFAAVYACIRVLAESVGQLPLHLYAMDGKSRERAIDHPLYSLLHDSPNKYQTAQEFWETCIVHLALRGNFYARKNVVFGTPRELLPLHPDSVTARQLTDYSVVYDVTYLDGQQNTLTTKDILHIPLMGILGVVGMSPISYARESIGLGIAMERHGSRLFANGAAPSGVLSVDGKLTQEATNRLRDEWIELHGGDGQRGIAILQAGAKYQSIGLTSEDAQFLETRKYQRSEVAGIFRVPPHMIADLERATFSNIEHQDLGFVKHALMPYLRRVEQRIWLSLLSDQDRKTHYAKFNVDSLLRGDAKSRAESLAIQLDRGVITPNEWRELDDRNPYDGGDVHLTPANFLIDGESVTGGSQEPPPAEPAAQPLEERAP